MRAEIDMDAAQLHALPEAEWVKLDGVTWLSVRGLGQETESPRFAELLLSLVERRVGIPGARTLLLSVLSKVDLQRRYPGICTQWQDIPTWRFYVSCPMAEQEALP